MLSLFPLMITIYAKDSGAGTIQYIQEGDKHADDLQEFQIALQTALSISCTPDGSFNILIVLHRQKISYNLLPYIFTGSI